MNVCWIVQANLIAKPTVEAIATACADQGHTFLPVEVIPFSEELPPVTHEEPAIFYGSARLTMTLAQESRFMTGRLFDHEAFTYARYIDALGDRMLNARADIIKVREITSYASQLDQDVKRFVRPVDDGKTFAGHLLTGQELLAWGERLIRVETTLGHEDMIVIASPQRIDEEWRLFMRAEEVISSSRYVLHGALRPKRGAPDDVLTFARRCAREYAPAPAFVMDVARIDGDKLRVIEFNGIQSSGFYDADVDAIVESLSAITIAHHRERHAAQKPK